MTSYWKSWNQIWWHTNKLVAPCGYITSFKVSFLKQLWLNLTWKCWAIALAGTVISDVLCWQYLQFGDTLKATLHHPTFLTTASHPPLVEGCRAYVMDPWSSWSWTKKGPRPLHVAWLWGNITRGWIGPVGIPWFGFHSFNMLETHI